VRYLDHLARDVDEIRSRVSSSRIRPRPALALEDRNKIALKVVQNGHITLKDVRGPENRLQGVLFPRHRESSEMTPYAVAWMATDARWARSRPRSSIPRSVCSSETDRLVPAHAGSSRQDAGEYHRFAMPDVRQAQLHDEGKRSDAHAALRGFHYIEMPRDGGVAESC